MILILRSLNRKLLISLREKKAKVDLLWLLRARNSLAGPVFRKEKSFGGFIVKFTWLWSHGILNLIILKNFYGIYLIIPIFTPFYKYVDVNLFFLLVILLPFLVFTRKIKSEYFYSRYFLFNIFLMRSEWNINNIKFKI